MISESVFAKNKILKYNRKIIQLIKKTKITKTQLFQTEINIFTSMFLTRKLIESKKISDSLVNKQLKLTKYKCIHKNNSINYFFDPTHYNLENPIEHKISLKNLTNQFIHSFHFFMFKDNDDIIIYLCSDHARNEEIYSINLSYISSLFDEIGNNYPSTMHIVKQKNGHIKFKIE